jgi:hypothetical protein
MVNKMMSYTKDQKVFVIKIVTLPVCSCVSVERKCQEFSVRVAQARGAIYSTVKHLKKQKCV